MKASRAAIFQAEAERNREIADDFMVRFDHPQPAELFVRKELTNRPCRECFIKRVVVFPVIGAHQLKDAGDIHGGSTTKRTIHARSLTTVGSSPLEQKFVT